MRSNNIKNAINIAVNNTHTPKPKVYTKKVAQVARLVIFSLIFTRATYQSRLHEGCTGCTIKCNLHATRLHWILRYIYSSNVVSKLYVMQPVQLFSICPGVRGVWGVVKW